MSNVVTNTMNNMLGNICKAVICVRDFNEVNGKDSSLLKYMNQGMGLAVSGIAKPGARMSDLKASLGGVMKEAGFKAYEVQYNPASISFYTTAEGSGGYVTGANDITQASTLMAQTSMSFELIFEDVSNQDAFDFTSLSMNLETGKDLIKDLVAGERSVTTQVQGFLGLLGSAVLQDVVFFWGSNVFRGKLADVDVTYTMFNKKGNPVFAKVRMKIQKTGEESDQADREYWEKALNTRFGKKNTYDDPYSGSTLADMF